MNPYLYFVPMVTSLLCLAFALTGGRKENYIVKRGELVVFLLFTFAPLANIALTVGCLFLFFKYEFDTAWERFEDWMDAPIFKDKP